MIKKDIEFLKKKTQAYFDKQISVHVKYKSGEWANGYINEQLSPDFFMLQERKKGLIPVFFLELEDIVPMNLEERNG